MTSRTKKKYLKLLPSTRKGKKWMIRFPAANGRRERLVHFGAKGMSDFTKHKNEQRKERYLARHAGQGEDWDDPYSPGALSRWILWNKEDINASFRDYLRRFPQVKG